LWAPFLGGKVCGPSGKAIIMSNLDCNVPNIKLTKPDGLAPRLFFQAYSGANPVAHAQLSSMPENQSRQRARRGAKDGSRAPGVSYCLKVIEVSQNYRNQGIGSALLEEVIRFCKEERVSSIYGEAKGELEILRKWYEGKGFAMDQSANIDLSIV
jgi:GNAT superfamily N-acetyltransferase